ncbi:MAG: hypothetical protein CW338_00335 [Clostridiales bacterium]|nr:hypothetical protein [Clostridiales bacterium]
MKGTGHERMTDTDGIRMVVSDLDGTLLDEKGALPEGMFDEIGRLKEKGIAFCAASGRQYANMRRMFSGVWRDISFICENGCLVKRGDEILSASRIGKQMAEELIRDIRDAGMQVLMSLPECTVMFADADRSFTDDIIYRLRNTAAIAEDPFMYAGEYIKISGFYDGDILPLSKPLQEKWQGRIHADVAGRSWLDFTPVNKGDALKLLCRETGIDPASVMAFGDQFNDLAMLNLCGHPCLSPRAPEEVRACGIPVTDSVFDKIRQL